MNSETSSVTTGFTEEVADEADNAHGGDLDVRLQEVTKRYGTSVAVDRLTLDVRKGEFLSLLGPSGCGKTTTLKLIAGFEQPSEGAILIGGQSAAGLPPHKRDVNTVFQQYALFPHLTVLDNVAYGLKQRGIGKAARRKQAEEALGLVGLHDRLQARPMSLSGGQQQRVALARAIVLRPRVLLLDEPLGALDLKLRQHMQIELKRIHAEVGLTFVFVTHDQGEALSMSDRIAVMNKGRIEQLADPQAVYDEPATPFVASFIGEMNQLTGRLVGDSVKIEGSGLVLPVARTVTPPAAGKDAVLIGVRPEDVSVVLAAPGAAHGRIETKMLAGHSLQFVVVLPDGQRLVVRQGRYGLGLESDRLRPGVEVAVEVAPNSVLLLGTNTTQPEGE